MAADSTIVKNVRRIVRETRAKEEAAKHDGQNRSTASRHALKQVEAGFDKIEEAVAPKRPASPRKRRG